MPLDFTLRCVYADTGCVVFFAGCVDVSQFYRKCHTFLNINSQNLHKYTNKITNEITNEIAAMVLPVSQAIQSLATSDIIIFYYQSFQHLH